MRLLGGWAKNKYFKKERVTNMQSILIMDYLLTAKKVLRCFRYFHILGAYLTALHPNTTRRVLKGAHS